MAVWEHVPATDGSEPPGPARDSIVGHTRRQLQAWATSVGSNANAELEELRLFLSSHREVTEHDYETLRHALNHMLDAVTVARDGTGRPPGVELTGS